MMCDSLKKPNEINNLSAKKSINVNGKTGITFNVWEEKNADGKGSGLYDWTSLLGSDKLMNNLTTASDVDKTTGN